MITVAISVGSHIKSKKSIGGIWPYATISSCIVNNSVQTR